MCAWKIHLICFEQKQWKDISVCGHGNVGSHCGNTICHKGMVENLVLVSMDGEPRSLVLPDAPVNCGVLLVSHCTTRNEYMTLVFSGYSCWADRMLCCRHWMMEEPRSLWFFCFRFLLGRPCHFPTRSYLCWRFLHHYRCRSWGRSW